MDKVGWMGEFNNPDMELTFRKHEWNGFRKRMIFASLVGGLAYFLALVGDFMTMTSESMFRYIFIMRFLVLLIALAVSLLGVLLKTPSRGLNLAICTLLFSVLLGESTELVIKSHSMEYIGLPAISVLVLLFYLSFPPRFIGVLSVCLVGCCCFLATCYLLGFASLNYIYTSLLYLVVVNFFGAYVYLQFAIMRRREYCAIVELKKMQRLIV